MPTVLEDRTTKFLSKNGAIYRMENLQPATVYYMRAYAISKNYAVGYGSVLKVITLPKGTMTYGLGSSVVNSGASYARIASAMQSCVYWFNNLSSIQGNYLDVSYNAGTPTAEASYGSYLRFGPSSDYQRTGTAIHEVGHTIGIGQHPIWYGPNSALRAGGTTGFWLGERAGKLARFMENNPTMQPTGDAVHAWVSGSTIKFGINGAFEDDGSDLVYISTVMLFQAEGEDALPPSGGFATPAYTFYQNDTTKYYIKTENENMGRNTTFLSENESGQMVNKVIGLSAALLNDSTAWYLNFVPATGYYQIRNAATGKYFTYQTSGVNGYTLTPTATPSTAQSFQLMGARYNTVIGNTGNSYSVKAYSIVRQATSPKTASPLTLGANIDGSTSSVTFNNRDTASTQHWLLLTNADVDSLQRVLAVILPVHLTKFTAKAAGAEVKLNWSTASEINSRKFEIERSANGIDFKYIGEVAAYRNSTVARDYYFTDKQPNTGTNFYRLKQIDNDGKSYYSPVRVVDLSLNDKGLTVFPNPASSYLYIKGLDQTTAFTYTIYSTSGVKVAKGNLSGAKINLPKLSDASYIIQIFENDRKIFTQSFVIKK
jgi:hypothetical protein